MRLIKLIDSVESVLNNAQENRTAYKNLNVKISVYKDALHEVCNYLDLLSANDGNVLESRDELRDKLKDVISKFKEHISND